MTIGTQDIGTRYERHAETKDAHLVFKHGTQRGYFYSDGPRWILAYGKYFERTRVFSTLRALQMHCEKSTLFSARGRPNAGEVIAAAR